VDDLRTRLSDDYEVRADRLATDIDELLQAMLGQGLLTHAGTA
jgi:hypothetical protein